MYLEGTSAFGKPAGHRFPTASGKLEFWTAALDQTLTGLGLSALPEFYADREHLIELPYVERRQDGMAEVERPFIHGKAWSNRLRLFSHMATPRARICNVRV